MSTPQEKVCKFMISYGQVTRTEHTNYIPQKEIALRVDLIAEELGELVQACGGKFDYRFTLPEFPVVDAVEAADALTDLRYVLYGAFSTFGLLKYFDELFDEVHESNMSKFNPDGSAVIDANGKVRKGPDYRQPDIARILLSKK